MIHLGFRGVLRVLQLCIIVTLGYIISALIFQLLDGNHHVVSKLNSEGTIRVNNLPSQQSNASSVAAAIYAQAHKFDSDFQSTQTWAELQNHSKHAMIANIASKHVLKTNFPKLEKEISNRCLKKEYDLAALPKVSIIICFHESESLENIKHTLHSIAQHTPAALLKEIILISDNSNKEDHHKTLDIYVNEHFAELVKVFRSYHQLGLIRARQIGATLATGEVIVCMDSHMEVQPLWLEPLLYEIELDRTTMCSAMLDWLKPKPDGSWIYEHGSSRIKSVWYWWRMMFTFVELSDNPSPTTDLTSPIISPCSVGTLWAMNKKFFFDVGGLDEGMEFWGGENIDLPIRVFMAGGKHVNIPCSHVAHMEATGQRDYRIGHLENVSKNYVRIVESLFDPIYKKTAYYYNPKWKKSSPGDMYKRKTHTSQYKHNFTYYMDNYFPEMQTPFIGSLAWGEVVNKELQNNSPNHTCLCIYPNPNVVAMKTCDNSYEFNKVQNIEFKNNAVNSYVGNTETLCFTCNIDTRVLRLRECLHTTPENGSIFLNFDGELRIAAHVLSPPKFRIYNRGSTESIPLMTIKSYITAQGNNQIRRWFHIKDGPLELFDVNNKHHHCLTIAFHKKTSEPLVTVVNCDSTDPYQNWTFHTYTKEYYDLVERSVLPKDKVNPELTLYYQRYLTFIQAFNGTL